MLFFWFSNKFLSEVAGKRGTLLLYPSSRGDLMGEGRPIYPLLSLDRLDLFLLPLEGLFENSDCFFRKVRRLLPYVLLMNG